MKQQNAFSFATLRISTVLAMLWALPVGPVSAIPIQLTSGGIFVQTSIFPATFFASSAALAGPGFLFTTTRLSDAFFFSVSSPNHPLDLLPEGTITSFSGFMQVVSGGNPPIPEDGRPPPATVIYGGESYFATGDIQVSTPTFVVGPLVTLPFSLSGFIHANNFNGGTELDFEIFGAGTVTAVYFQYPSGLPEPSFYWLTPAITYTIEPAPIPEPTSWLLLGSGLLGVAARRRSTRPSHAPSAHHRAVIGGAMKKATLLSLVFCVVSVAQAAADTVQGFVYTGGTFTSIVPGVDTQASGINDAGQFVGSFTDSRGDPTGGFLYTAGSITTIPLPLPPGTSLEFPLGINDAGQIVGAFEDSSSPSPPTIRHGFLYDAGTFTTIDVPGSVLTVATGINDAGDIVGVFFDGRPGGSSRGFVLDTAGSFTMLDAPGAIATSTLGINDAGQIVGSFSDGSINPFRGFLYDAGAYMIIDVPGRGQTFAHGINDAGQIVGYSFPEGPVPEPGSMLLFGSGLAGIWAFASRKRRSA